MANPKTVNFVSQPIRASQIADFYNRLNALRSLGNVSAVSFSAPSVGTKAFPSIISQVESAITSTKSALSFLTSVDISQYTPVTPAQGDLIEAYNTIHPLEWQVGQLESACFTNFTVNRAAVKLSNFVSFATGTDGCTSVYNAHRQTNFTAQRGTNFTAQRGTNFTAQRATNFTTRFKTYFKTFRHYVHTSFNRGHGCATFGTQFKPVHRVVYSSFFVTQFTANFTTQFTANFTTQFTANFGSNCAPHFLTNNAAQRSSNREANCSANDASNFTAFTATYYANHASFTVSPMEGG